MVDLSIVLPLHNEEPNLAAVYTELKSELEKLQHSYEIIFVDDGSTDKSYAKLTAILRQDSSVRIIKLLARSGQSSALAAGSEYAQGKYIVTMDSDGQHDPKDIAKLIKPLDQGYHVVCGWRTKRQNSDSYWTKNVPSKISNWLVNRVSGLNLKDSVGGMKAFDKRVTDNISIFGDLHRYLPVLAAWKGFRVTEVPINVRKRKGGKTKYTWRRLTRGFWDLLVVRFFMSWSNRPSQFFGLPAIASFLLGLALAIFLAYEKFWLGAHLAIDRPLLLIIDVFLIFIGFVFTVTAFIADMISYEAIAGGKKKAYIIEHVAQAKPPSR